MFSDLYYSIKNSEKVLQNERNTQTISKHVFRTPLPVIIMIIQNAIFHCNQLMLKVNKLYIFNSMKLDNLTQPNRLTLLI